MIIALLLASAADAGTVTYLYGAPQPWSRFDGAEAETLNNGKILVTGPASNAADEYKVSLFNPTTEAWEADYTTQCPYPRYAEVLPNGIVFLYDATSNAHCTELLNPATGVSTLTSTPPMINDGRFGAAVVAMPNGQVLIAGGNNGNVTHDTAFVYTPGTDTWSIPYVLDEEKAYMSAIVLGAANPRVYLMGGFRQWVDFGLCGGTCFDAFDTIEYWDVNAGGFTTQQSRLLSERYGAPVAQSPTQSWAALLCGGYDLSGGEPRDCMTYDGSGDVVTFHSTITSDRAYSRMFIGGIGQALIPTHGLNTDQMEHYNGASWGSNGTLNTTDDDLACAAGAGAVYCFSTGPLEVHRWTP